MSHLYRQGVVDVSPVQTESGRYLTCIDREWYMSHLYRQGVVDVSPV